MFLPVRERLSDALLTFGAERALERQQMERSLQASADPDAVGCHGALAALLTAEMFERATLWLGWRLQPRRMSPQ